MRQRRLVLIEWRATITRLYNWAAHNSSPMTHCITNFRKNEASEGHSLAPARFFAMCCQITGGLAHGVRQAPPCQLLYAEARPAHSTAPSHTHTAPKGTPSHARVSSVLKASRSRAARARATKTARGTAP